MEYISKKFTDKDGKMFHTGVGEGELAPSVLMPGDPARSKIISGCFKDPKFISNRRTYATYTGVTPIPRFPFPSFLPAWAPCASALSLKS